jgi:hypothetical protein
MVWYILTLTAGSQREETVDVHESAPLADLALVAPGLPSARAAGSRSTVDR